MNQYVGVKEIQAATGMTAGHIYKLAHDHQWRRVKVGVIVRYHIQDVLNDCGVSDNDSVTGA